MNYRPNDFFIGIIDFFGILVPGAVFLFLHGGSVVKTLGLGSGLEQTTMWAVFLLGSYVLGHFLLGIGVLWNRLLHFSNPKAKDKFYMEAKKMISLPPGREDSRTDAFYRAYSLVRLKSPSALAEIERQMADYKLFRGLMVVFALDLLLVMLHSGTPRWPRLLFSGLLLIFATRRFLFLLGWTYRITFEYYTLLSRMQSSESEELRSV